MTLLMKNPDQLLKLKTNKKDINLLKNMKVLIRYLWSRMKTSKSKYKNQTKIQKNFSINLLTKTL